MSASGWDEWEIRLPGGRVWHKWLAHPEQAFCVRPSELPAGDYEVWRNGQIMGHSIGEALRNRWGVS